MTNKANTTAINLLVENKAKTYNDYMKNVENVLEKGVNGDPKYIEILSRMASPCNPETPTVYKGVNRLVLSMVALAKGYKDNRWYTMKNIQDHNALQKNKDHQWSLKAQDSEKGYQKGDQKCVEIMYFIPKYLYDLDKDGNIDWRHGKSITQKEYDALSEKDKKRVFTKTIKSFVFNAEQIDGVEPLVKPNKKYSTKLIEHIAKAMNVGLELGSNKERPCYSPTENKVYMPDSFLFKKNVYLQGAGLHELSHATGHKSRLNRDMTGRFGSQSYAFEELVAESSAAMLCAFLGIEKEVDENHKAYVKSWLSVCKDKAKALIEAFKLAEQACQYIVDVADLENYVEKTETAKAKAKAKRTSKEVSSVKAEKKVAKTKAVKTTKKETAKKEKTVRKTTVPKMTEYIKDGIKIVRLENGDKWSEMTRSFYDSLSSQAKKIIRNEMGIA